MLKTLPIAFLLFLASELASASMPIPKGLQSDINFWEKIFHTYKPNHCVIHDKSNLNSIFIVKELPNSPRRRRVAVRKYLKEVKTGLSNLGRGRIARNNLERRIVKGTPSYMRNRNYYRSASHRIRCQRGVSIRSSITKSHKYVGMIKKVLHRYKLPEELAYLPHLESGFNHKAHSRAGARGIWQLMKFNAKNLGLRVSRWNDQRTSPYKSTVAAAKLLTQLKRNHKQWPLAVTAYNYGTNGMRRAIKKYGYDYMKIRKKHKTRIFGFAVKNYYPSFLAAKNVTKRIAGETPKAGAIAKGSSSKGRFSL